MMASQDMKPHSVQDKVTEKNQKPATIQETSREESNWKPSPTAPRAVSELEYYQYYQKHYEGKNITVVAESSSESTSDAYSTNYISASSSNSTSTGEARSWPSSFFNSSTNSVSILLAEDSPSSSALSLHSGSVLMLSTLDEAVVSTAEDNQLQGVVDVTKMLAPPPKISIRLKQSERSETDDGTEHNIQKRERKAVKSAAPLEDVTRTFKTPALSEPTEETDVVKCTTNKTEASSALAKDNGKKVLKKSVSFLEDLPSSLSSGKVSGSSHKKAKKISVMQRHEGTQKLEHELYKTANAQCSSSSAKFIWTDDMAYARESVQRGYFDDIDEETPIMNSSPGQAHNRRSPSHSSFAGQILHPTAPFIRTASSSTISSLTETKALSPYYLFPRSASPSEEDQTCLQHESPKTLEEACLVLSEGCKAHKMGRYHVAAQKYRHSAEILETIGQQEMDDHKRNMIQIKQSTILHWESRLMTWLESGRAGAAPPRTRERVAINLLPKFHNQRMIWQAHLATSSSTQNSSSDILPLSRFDDKAFTTLYYTPVSAKNPVQFRTGGFELRCNNSLQRRPELMISICVPTDVTDTDDEAESLENFYCDFENEKEFKALKSDLKLLTADEKRVLQHRIRARRKALGLRATLLAVLENLEYLRHKGFSTFNGENPWQNALICIFADEPARGKEGDLKDTLQWLSEIGIFDEDAVKVHAAGIDPRMHIFEGIVRLRRKPHMNGLVEAIDESSSGFEEEEGFYDDSPATPDMGPQQSHQQTRKYAATAEISAEEFPAVPLQILFALSRPSPSATAGGAGAKLRHLSWFFNGFAGQVEPEFTILLDSGAIPRPYSFYNLLAVMDTHPTVGGACGELVTRKTDPLLASTLSSLLSSLGSSSVLSSSLAGSHYSTHTSTSSLYKALFKNWTMAAQHFERKTSYILDRTMESAFGGFVSSMPLAFCAYRYKAIKGAPLDKFFQSMAIPASENQRYSYKQNFIKPSASDVERGEARLTLAQQVGDEDIAERFDGDEKEREKKRKNTRKTVKANLEVMIALDRHLAFEVIAKENSRWTLCYVKSAAASVEVPQNVVALMEQRQSEWHYRDQLFASLYALRNWDRIYLESEHPWWRKNLLIVQIILQCIRMMMDWLMPGTLYILIHSMFSVVFELFLDSAFPSSEIPLSAATMLPSSASDGNLTAAQAQDRLLLTRLSWRAALHTGFQVVYGSLFLCQVVSALGNRPRHMRKLHTVSSLIFGLFMCVAIVMGILVFASSFSSSITLPFPSTTSRPIAASVPPSSSSSADPAVILIAILSVGTYVIVGALQFEVHHILLTGLQYLIYLPTLVNLAQVYSYANIHDLPTWSSTFFSSSSAKAGQKSSVAVEDSISSCGSSATSLSSSTSSTASSSFFQQQRQQQETEGKNSNVENGKHEKRAIGDKASKARLKSMEPSSHLLKLRTHFLLFWLVSNGVYTASVELFVTPYTFFVVAFGLLAIFNGFRLFGCLIYLPVFIKDRAVASRFLPRKHHKESVQRSIEAQLRKSQAGDVEDDVEEVTIKTTVGGSRFSKNQSTIQVEEELEEQGNVAIAISAAGHPATPKKP